MVRRYGRPTWILMAALVAVLAASVSVWAQGGAMVRGVVLDDKGQPVEGATVAIVATGGSGRKFEVKTNRRGEFIQIGLASGPYTLTAEKDKLGSAPANVTVRAGAPAEAKLVLGFAAASATKEAAAKADELKKSFEEGVTASNAGRHDEAIAKFNQGILISPNCFDCYNNIGFSHTQKKEYEQAEAAYKKSTEIKADDASAWNGLANVYNAQRKFDLAAQAGAKATELSGVIGASGGASGNADALYNQGVILWNAGKIAEAKKSFEGAVQANPSHAEAHYQLGMALVNEGNLAGGATEFEAYLKLAPTGPNAATAKSLVAQLKK